MNALILAGAMVVAAVLGAVGQIALKVASEVFSLRALASGPIYVFGITYGLAVLINMWVYNEGGKVSLMYPIISLSYVFAAFFAWRFLGENVNGSTWIGIATIMVGVSIIGWSVYQ